MCVGLFNGGGVHLTHGSEEARWAASKRASGHVRGCDRSLYLTWACCLGIPRGCNGSTAKTLARVERDNSSVLVYTVSSCLLVASSQQMIATSCVGSLRRRSCSHNFACAWQYIFGDRNEIDGAACCKSDQWRLRAPDSARSLCLDRP